MAPCYTNFEKDDYLCKKLNSPSITMKRKQPCVRAICHGHHVPRPILSVDNAPFDDFVIKKLKAIKFCGPSCIQSVVWPAVLRGRSVIAVGPPHSGKTLSYLLPLLSSVLQLNTYLEIPDGSGPLVLILCSSWRKVQKVHSQFQQIVEGTKRPRCLMLYGGAPEKSQELQLINGCDFLIATPSSFLRMLHNHEGKVTNLRRCCHLVLDDGETLVEDFTKQVRDVLMEYASSVRQRGDIAAPNQIILCTEKWTEGTKSFMYNCMKDPLVFFSSLFEAAIYALIPNFVEICDSSQRTATLLNLVSNNNGLKIVVCMSSPALALEVHRILKNFSIYSILAHDNMLHYDLNEVAQEWHTSHAYGSHPVLVVSDNILSALQVRNAQCLIHYDLPEISRFQFGSRYLTLSDYFPRIAELSKEDLKTLEVECFSHLILTEDSLKQTTTLVQFIERTGRKAPLKLKEMAKKYQNEYFKQTNVPLCLNLKAYGRCSSEDKCFKRHHIAIQDKPVNLPTSGEVKVLITHVVNASHLFVQLLGHRTLSTSDDASFLQFTPWNNEVQRLKTELNDYYKVFENCKPNLQPVEGDICALKDKDENILRVMIKSGPQLTQAGDSVKVKVYSIDEGKELYVELDHLLLLPEEWKQVSSQVVEVFMCRVQPVDGDLQWTPQASIFIHHLIHRKELVGRIALCIGHTLWLDPLVVRERLENVNIWVNAVRPRSELIKAGYAISNPNHLKSLYKACQGQIPVSTEILRTDSKPLYKQQNYPKPELPHGFLELGAYQDIYVSVVQTPHLVFCAKSKHYFMS
ncbi:putative ATP-dependent RNA helicase TDRD12 [Tachypleus tridentatus]|uniref:putative ATP-dependent RNA helicase TDRD12 n=1 Tax=Tachypleus tridentatus TaxID=6853 RepID=UPI003FD49AD2